MKKTISQVMLYNLLLVFTIISCSKDPELQEESNVDAKWTVEDSLQFLHPYVSSSAWNRPIGTNADYSGTASDLTHDIQLKNWYLNASNGWGFGVYVSGNADPLMTVGILEPKRGLNLPYQLHIPEDISRLPLTLDGQVVIYDKTTKTVHEFYRFRWNDGAPLAAIHRTDDTEIEKNPANPTKIESNPEQNIYTGTGHYIPGVSTSRVIGTRATFVAGLAGPGIYPEHALTLELSYEQLSAKYQWPAAYTDGNASTTNSGHINYGALVAIPPQSKGGPNLNTLGLTDAGMRIAKALVYYGAYVTDRRGHNCGLEGDQDIPNNISQDVKNDMKKLTPYLRIILNNSYDQACSGGGGPLNRD